MDVPEVYINNQYGDAINIDITHIEVNKHADAIDSPVESGTKVFDNKVIQPINISLEVVADAGNYAIHNIINTMLKNRTYQFYTIGTKEGVYENMMMIDASHTESDDKFDKIVYQLQFKEILIARSSSQSFTIGKLAKASDASTVSTGRKIGSTYSPRMFSTVTGALNFY